MSTYYFLGCEACQELTSFVASRIGWSWMAQAIETVPVFVARHAAHPDRLVVFSEHDPRRDAFTDWSASDARTP